jgi:hypothetical protein
MNLIVRSATAVLALAGLLGGSAAQARVELPTAPAWSIVQPISLVGTGSEPMSYNGAIFRIQMGTQLGAVYRIGQKKAVSELRWDKQAGISREFNVAVNDRLREFGYSVIDISDQIFENTNAAKARYKLGAIVTKLETNYYFKRDGYRASDQSYGIASLDMELQIQDTDTQKIVFRGQYQGYGIEQAKSPQPLYVAFLNAVDHALADPGFVAPVRTGAAQDSPGKDVLPLVAITRCDHESDAHLPGKIGTLTNAVVGLRAGNISGSGVVISPDGYILTAAHVVAGRESVVVKLVGGLELDASVLRVDSGRDIALLKLPGRGYKCASVAFDLAPVGTDLFAVGTPLNPELANSITRGIVSGYRTIDNVRLLQTDASINPGNSGGPLFDSAGRVQAIVSFKAVGNDIEGIAFGVPIEVAARRLVITLN